jgi:hypothetical protein
MYLYSQPSEQITRSWGRQLPLIDDMKAIARAQQLTRHLAYTTRSKAPSMKLDINSTLRMKSGYEIPVLGYGR